MTNYACHLLSGQFFLLTKKKPAAHGNNVSRFSQGYLSQLFRSI